MLKIIMKLMLLEVNDAAQALGVSPALVRVLAVSGRLSVAATTPRGVRLFDPDAVEALRRDRERAAPRRAEARAETR